MMVDIADVVTYTNFGDHRLRGFWVAGGQISPSPIDYFFWGGFLRKATAETRAPILTTNTSNDVVPRKEVPFGGRETKI